LPRGGGVIISRDQISDSDEQQTLNINFTSDFIVIYLSVIYALTLLHQIHMYLPPNKNDSNPSPTPMASYPILGHFRELIEHTKAHIHRFTHIRTSTEQISDEGKKY